jgi:two-component system, NtrC family, sensor histidine kinase GlrK
MRLVARLSLSHAVPIGLLLLALSAVLLSLVKMTSLIGQVRDDELGTIAQEEALHDAAWAVEVSARRGGQGCVADRAVAPHVGADLRARQATLEAALARTPRGREGLVRAADNYRVLAARLSEGDACEQLLSAATRHEMLVLDEELTDVWIQRLRELHGSMTRKEDEARTLGARATASGVVTAALACAFAALLARLIARTVTEPMARLAGAARRMGEGDFGAPVPVRGPTEVVQLGVELDVMRRKLAELDGLKQGFLAQVSHELRTPLTKLREALALLGDGAAGTLTDRQVRVVKIARDACEREIRMVSTLLDLSRLQAGSPLRMQSAASLDEVVRAAVLYEEAEASARGVPIDVQTEGEGPSMDLDPALIERAIANLVRNAVSVSGPGQRVTVRREFAAGRKGEPGVRVLVSDDGPGVPGDAKGELFKPFATHAVEGTSHRVGVGLGLALSREVARAHGGEVELLEQRGVGAMFSLWLPVDREGARRPASAAGAVAGGAAGEPGSGGLGGGGAA